MRKKEKQEEEGEEEELIFGLGLDEAYAVRRLGDKLPGVRGSTGFDREPGASGEPRHPLHHPTPSFATRRQITPDKETGGPDKRGQDKVAE